MNKNPILTVLEKLAQAFVHLTYPPICLHCYEGLEDPKHLLCKHCLALLSLLEWQGRCPTCFGEDYQTESGRCSHCSIEKPWLHKLAAAFDYMGPAATLVKQFKYSNKPYLVNALASYMVAQFCLLEWPIPDLIVPVPMSWAHFLGRGYNQSALLAKEIARMLGCAYGDVLQRNSGAYSQAGLSTKQRLLMTADTIHIKKDKQFYDKTLLLVDDVMTTGSTMSRCAEVLISGYPQHIYGLTLCKA